MPVWKSLKRITDNYVDSESSLYTWKFKEKCAKLHILEKISSESTLFVNLQVRIERVEWALNKEECNGVEIYFIYLEWCEMDNFMYYIQEYKLAQTLRNHLDKTCNTLWPSNAPLDIQAKGQIRYSNKMYVKWLDHSTIY